MYYLSAELGKELGCHHCIMQVFVLQLAVTEFIIAPWHHGLIKVIVVIYQLKLIQLSS